MAVDCDTVPYWLTVSLRTPGTWKMNGPSTAEAVKVVARVVPEPATVTEREFVPAAAPRVQLPPLATPEPLVSDRLLEMDPPPAVTARETLTPASNVVPSATTTLGAEGSTVPLKPDCELPVLITIVGFAA